MTVRRYYSTPESVRTNVNVDDAGCWLWAGHVDRTTGYGFAGALRSAHRLSYRVFVGPIPDGLYLDHLCRVRHCVNPSHLEAVTPRINSLRGEAPTMVAHVKGVCLRGHSMADAKVRRSNGVVWRTCRTCWKAARAARLARMALDREDRAHGTPHGYSIGCRCAPCTGAMVKHVARYARQRTLVAQGRLVSRPVSGTVEVGT